VYINARRWRRAATWAMIAFVFVVLSLALAIAVITSLMV
jgi:hypothetical protein